MERLYPRFQKPDFLLAGLSLDGLLSLLTLVKQEAVLDPHVEELQTASG